MPRRVPPTDPCSVESCPRPAWARGWCHTHYERWRRNGDLLLHIPLRQTCAVDGCEKPAVGHSYCNKHYQRFRKYGDPLYTQVAPRGSGYINGGYQMFGRNGKRIRAHRDVVEGILGRPLGPDEVIHHKNGDRLDNRPENLEIMTWETHIQHHATKNYRDAEKKECGRCHRILPRSEFSPAKSPPGHNYDPNCNKCKACARIVARFYHQLKARTRPIQRPGFPG